MRPPVVPVCLLHPAFSGALRSPSSSFFGGRSASLRARRFGRESREAIMAFVQAALLSGLLLAACVFTHYEAFRWMSDRFAKPHVKDRRLVLEVVAIAFVAHVAEMVYFAAGYYVADNVLGLGKIAGADVPGVLDYLYVSMETYTSLGLGDIHPTGPMRLLVGLETLAGLMLIGWSSSFTYLSMRRFWDVSTG
jgi:Ion channel